MKFARHIPLVAAVLLVTTFALAGSIKSWGTGETLKATDLNSNFNHIHNLMVGGHGARLVDGDVSASAAIAHSKLANPTLVPKAVAGIGTGCDGSLAITNVCGGTITAVGVSTITSSATVGGGVWNVNLSYTPPNTAFPVMVTCRNNAFCSCTSSNPSTSAPHFLVRCFDAAGAALNNVPFDIVVWDDNN